MATDRVKILYLDHTSQLGGAERSLLDLLGRLDRSRIEPIVATSAGGPLIPRLEALGIEVVFLGLDEAALTLSREEWGRNRLAFVWKARSYLGEVRRLARFVRSRGILAVHSNTLKAHVLGSVVAGWARCRLVWHMRDLPSTRGDSRRLLERLFLRVRPGIIAISRAVADDLTPAMRERCRVVYNGIDVQLFDQRAAVPVRLVEPAAPGPVIGTISHLIPWKGQDFFLHAAARLRSTVADAHFVIVGDPIFQFQGERERLEGLASELGVRDRVIFAGHREDVPGLLAGLDLFVLPSLYEPFGRVLIEAMAAGLPIVASRAGGVPEIVIDGETGVLVPAGDPQALATAIADLLADPVRAQALGTAARRRVEASFSLDATLSGVMAAYEAFGILSAPLPPRPLPQASR